MLIGIDLFISIINCRCGIFGSSCAAVLFYDNDYCSCFFSSSVCSFPICNCPLCCPTHLIVFHENDTVRLFVYVDLYSFSFVNSFCILVASVCLSLFRCTLYFRLEPHSAVKSYSLAKLLSILPRRTVYSLVSPP